MYEEITGEIRRAARERKKTAMIHYQALIHAEELADVHPADFCRKVGIEDTWAVEVRKMLDLAKLLKERGIRLDQPPRSSVY